MEEDSGYYTENELLSRLAGGNEIAFREIYEKYQQRVFSFAMHFLKSETLAKEVVMDVFLGIWIKRETLLGIERLEAYLYTVTRNKCFNFLKKEALETAARGVYSTRSDNRSAATDEAVYIKEIDELLEKAVNLLPPQQKKVYILSRHEGLKHSDIARQLQISPHTVNVHLTQGLRSIRRYLSARLPAILLFLTSEVLLKK